MDRNKRKRNNLRLHMLGKLQTNKVKQALKIFDYVHSLDSIKLAKKFLKSKKKYKKRLNFLFR